MAAQYSHLGMGAISDNAADFSKALLKMAATTGDYMEMIIRKTCIDLYTRIVKGWPRDTGRSAASWGLSTGSLVAPEPPERGWPKKEFSEAERNANIAEYTDKELGGFSFSVHDDQVVIYNNVEYVPYLENGSSQQAPQGVVNVALVEFETMFNKNIREFEGVSP